MPLLQYVTDRRNKIIAGSASAVGLIVALAVGLNQSTPAYVVENSSGQRVWQVNFSGSTIQSGSLVWEGAGSGASLYVATSLEGGGLVDCDADNQTVSWDATSKRFGCGDDDTGAAGTPEVGTISLSGAVLRLGDARYLKLSGGTLTGALIVSVTGGTRDALGARVINTLSGAHLHAEQQISGSGGAVIEGTIQGGDFVCLSPGCVGAAELGTDSVASDEIAADQVGQSEINANVVDFAELQDALDMDAAVVINSSGHDWTFNLDGGDSDFTIEGDNDQGLFFLDASTDRIGVGTTSPDAKLDVVGTISGALVTQNGAGSNYFKGNVGIVTTSPKAALDVLGGMSGTSLTVNGVTNTSSGVIIAKPGGREMIRLTDRTRSRSASVFTGSGSPFNGIAASSGSLYLDNYSGWLYTSVKGGGSNRGWRLIQPAANTGTIYPTRATIWADEVAAVAGSMTTSFEANQIYQYYEYSSGSQNDAWTSSFCLKAGTYTLKALGVASPNRGISTFYVDGVSVGTMDWYNVGTVFNSVPSISSVSVTTDGCHLLRSVMATKNASSAGYELLLTKVWFEPATDVASTTPRFP